jgi:hypothetical protein
VLNINECGLEALPRPLENLSSLKALIAMNNPWTTIGSDICSRWTELNSLSEYSVALHMLHAARTC